MEWDWNYTFEILPRLWQGVKVTLLATLLGSILALILGMLIAFLRHSAPRPVRLIVVTVTDFIRSTPLLVQLYAIFYMLPQIGIVLSPFAAGIIGIGLHYACYTAEVYRAGIEAIPKAQWESAKAVNMTRAQTWRYVIIPQAVPPVIPALANYIIGMFKETSLLSAITVVELVTQARHVSNLTYRYLEPFTMVGVFFLALSIPAALAVAMLERRQRRQVRV